MENNTKTYPNKAQSWGVLGIVILVTIVVSIVMEFTLKKMMSKDFSTFFAYTLAMVLAFLIVHYIRKKKTGSGSYSFKTPRLKVVLLAFFAVLGIQLGVTIPIASSIPMPDFVEKMFMEVFGNMGVWSVFTAVIMAPILEELIFRGVILDGLLKKYRATGAIFLSALLFGIVHLNPWQFVGAFLLGLLFGWVYWQTKSLLLTILLHFFNNGLASAQMLFSNQTPEEMINVNLVDTYGGLTNVFLIIPLAILVAVSSMLLLKKDFESKSQDIIV